MRTKKPKQIIPYTREALKWHLQTNVMGLNTHTIERIVQNCEGLNNGKYSLQDQIGTSGVTMAEMLDDLRIDYNQSPFN